MERLTVLSVAFCMLSATGVGMAESVPAKGPRCHAVDANFQSALAPEGCAGFACAAGAIANDAFLKGPMFVTLQAAAPSAGIPTVPASTLSVAGVRTLNPRRGGTLTADVIGVFDTSRGTFAELNIIIGGTGIFTGASGTLHVSGRPAGVDAFQGEITGNICWQ
jgi:hypothetical protein